MGSFLAHILMRRFFVTKGSFPNDPMYPKARRILRFYSHKEIKPIGLSRDNRSHSLQA